MTRPPTLGVILAIDEADLDARYRQMHANNAARQNLKPRRSLFWVLLGWMR